MRYLLFFILLISCNSVSPVQVVNIEDIELSLSNGVVLYKSKIFTGTLVAKDFDGVLSYTCNYVKGRKVGEEKKWYSNGQLESHRFYNDGVKVGIHKGWWPSGLPKFTLEFNTQGAYHGIVKEWFENGTLSKSFHYVNGKEEGGQQLYKPNGNIRANYVVRDGERYGLIGLKKCDAILVK
ncbi:MAG: toxin-antitoxin system YwqK family antitoxin [Flavicella sp.]